MNLELTSDCVRDLEALILFGSQARGDADSTSDIDVAAFGEATTMEGLACLKARATEHVNGDISLSMYSTGTAETMARSGSLFLWHLRLEGKVLAKRSEWLDCVFKILAPYSDEKAERDLQTFLTVLRDTQESLDRGTTTLLFDMSNLFAVLRSLGMIASMLDGTPCFSRLGPIRQLKTFCKNHFPLSSDEVDLLHSAKLFYSGKSIKEPDLNPKSCRVIPAKISRIAQMMRRSVQSCTATYTRCERYAL
jgi:hypothetical protein